MLRIMGAKVGRHVHLYPSSQIYYPWTLEIGDYSAIGEDALIYNLGPIKIGQRTTISHRAHLCAGTHDHTDADFPLRRSTISIGDDVWICAGTFVGPDVVVGDGAVVGAMAAVFKDVEPWTIVGGNPAKFIKRRVIDPKSTI